MYNSPISITHGPLELEYIDKYLQPMSSAADEQIVARVRCTLGVDIDRDELIKALNYDRQQYEKGYEDGEKAAVKHGRWRSGVYQECGYDWGKDAPIANVPKYCPHCGAKMDEKGDAE